MAGDDRFRGPAGEPGAAGAKGEPGTSGKDAELEHEQLAAEMLKRFPSLIIQFTDKSGQVVEELPFAFDPKTNAMVARFKPLPVEVYDANGKLTDSDHYPYAWGIKLKPIVIPPTKGS